MILDIMNYIDVLIDGHNDLDFCSGQDFKKRDFPKYRLKRMDKK